MKIINTGDYKHSIVIDDQRCREKMLGTRNGKILLEKIDTIDGGILNENIREGRLI